MASRLKIVLAAFEETLAKSFDQCADGLPDVEVHRGSIFDVDCDAYVSPANSFGFMDGGIDAQYVERFGEAVQTRVRRSVLFHHYGELLVGAAVVVETGEPKTPFLIAAPTMRVPMWLGPETANPYLAARAVLLLIREGVFPDGPYQGVAIRDHIKSVAFPGLGTGVGGVPHEISAHQIRQAIVQHRNAAHALPQSWAEASERHQLLYTERPRRLQK